MTHPAGVAWSRVARLGAQSPPTGARDQRRLPGKGWVVGWMTVGCC